MAPPVWCSHTYETSFRAYGLLLWLPFAEDDADDADAPALPVAAAALAPANVLLIHRSVWAKTDQALWCAGLFGWSLCELYMVHVVVGLLVLTLMLVLVLWMHTFDRCCCCGTLTPPPTPRKEEDRAAVQAAIIAGRLSISSNGNSASRRAVVVVVIVMAERTRNEGE